MIEDALCCDKLIVSTLLDDSLPTLKDDNVVRVADSRQSVGNHNRRAPGRCAVQCLLHHRLALVVKRRGRLVKQQNARVSDQ